MNREKEETFVIDSSPGLIVQDPTPPQVGKKRGSYKGRHQTREMLRLRDVKVVGSASSPWLALEGRVMNLVLERKFGRRSVA